MESSSPTVVSVNSKSTPGVHKLPREQITLVANHGVEGDYHAGATVRHRSRVRSDPAQPNRRQVHLIHAELFDEVAVHGISVSPGDMGENITTRGLAILDLAPGSRLRLGADAVIELTGVRNPCKQLNDVDLRLLEHVALKSHDGSIIRKAGVMAVVITGGVVRAGDGIVVEAPHGAACTRRLEPV
jgi:MOSC domain-containing protein YiiM